MPDFDESIRSPEDEESLDLAQYYHVLVKHKRVIIASLVVIVTLTMLFTFQTKPVYRGGSLLVIEKEQTTSPLTGERMDYESSYSESLTFNTHFKLITSRPVLEAVIKNLRLDQLESESALQVSLWKELLARFRKNINLLLGRERKSLPQKEKLAQLAESLRGKIDVQRVRETRLLRVSVEDHDPLIATKIANALAESYIQFNITNRLKSSENTLTWMTDQLYEMKKKLEDAEEAFLAYRQREKLFSIEGKQSVITQKIEEFNDAYITARNKRLELDAKLGELRRITRPQKEDLTYARSLFENSLIDTLYAQLLDSEVELSRLSKVYRSKHPKVIQIQSKINKSRKKLLEELKKEMENLKAVRSVLLAREEALQKTVDDYENDALETNRKALKYRILQRNVELNQKLYDTLLSKIKESNIVGNIDVSNIRIAEKAMLPVAPVRPKKKLNLILSIILGLMIGIGLAFFRGYLDRSIHTEEDVQRYLGLPVLSVIPVVDGKEVQEQKSENSKNADA